MRAQPTIAIVHDWLYGGGAEQVVLALHRLYPDAPIYTSYCSRTWREKLDNKVVTGYLQHWPFAQLRRLLPVLRQRWFTRLDLGQFDIIISSSGNGEAKFIRTTRPDQRHICYCHTPTHFYWRHYQEYLRRPSFRPRWLARLGLRLLVRPLRRRDYQAAQRVDVFLANSTAIQADIKQFYDRDSIVVFPPVQTTSFMALAKTRPRSVTLPTRPRCLVWGRLVPMKRLDLVIEACQQLGWPLDIMGDGPDREQLEKLAGESTRFLGYVSDEARAAAIQQADLFIFTAHEDFGVAPVEALAAGLPVVAYQAGGALDYISPGKNGWFFAEQTVESLVATLQTLPDQRVSPRAIAASAKPFAEHAFTLAIKKIVTNERRGAHAHRH